MKFNIFVFMLSKISHILLVCIGISILFSCRVETAKERKYQFVTIYSDCLSHQDKALFRNFTKQTHIHVKIHYLETDSLIQTIRQEGVNTNADLIVLKSLWGGYLAQKNKLLNRCKSEELSSVLTDRFSSKDLTLFGLGLDPYILIGKSDLDSIPSIYYELLKQPFEKQWVSNVQNTEDIIPFLSPGFKYKKRGLARAWLEDFYKKQLHTKGDLEAKLNAPYVLTYFSEYNQFINQSDTLEAIYQPIFLNQEGSGSFFNMHCAGIVKQAKNFENAKILLAYMVTNRFNEYLNNKWKTIPISLHARVHPFEYQNFEFHAYKGKVVEQVLNYNFIYRLTRKVKRSYPHEIYIAPIPIVNEVADSLQVEKGETSTETTTPAVE